MNNYTKNLKPKEVVIEVIKKYYLTYSGNFLLSLILFLLPFFLLYLLFSWGRWGLALFGLLLSIGIFIFIRLIINYKNNNLIITNQRLIYYKQSGFFHRWMYEVYLDKIQDLSYEIKGFYQTIFKYGILNIQVINSNTLIKIEKIKSPDKIQHLINQTKEIFLNNISKQSHFTPDQLSAIIAKLKATYGESEINQILSQQ